MDNEKKKVASLLAEQMGRAMGQELDAHSSSENRPELEDQIITMIYQKARQKPRQTKTVCLVLSCVLCFFLLGAAVVYQLAFDMSDHGTHIHLVPLETQEELKKNGFQYIVDLPEQYSYTTINKTGDCLKAIFSCGDDALVFTQSTSDLMVNIDAEGTNATTVRLPNGHEGVYIEKNGATLVWKQGGGYYLMLFTTDETIDLVAVASTTKKL